MNELKPCPFCGSYYRRVCNVPTYYKPNPHVYYVKCWDCEAQGARHFTEAEAVEAWNSRSERTCKSTTDDNAWCFVCSECGKSFPRSQLHLAHNHGEINYCPTCGAKVVRDGS